MAIADLAPGEHAATVRDHWWWRPGWRVGRRFHAFHVTFAGADPLYELVGAYRRALTGLDVTTVPDRWLHLTMQGVDFADDLPAATTARLVERAREVLAGVPAFEVSFGGEVVVGDEAVALTAEPAGPLRELRRAVRAVIGDVRGADRVPEDPDRYRPHVSVAYLTSPGPSAPYRIAVSQIRPRPVRVRVDRVDLIALHRDDRLYEWTTVAPVPLGDSSP